MERSRYINISHELRSAEARKKRLAFAAAYAMLFRKRVTAGQDIRGIQVLAANAAGFGEESWSDAARYQTQRSMSARLMKDPVVHDELRRLGFVYDERSKKWHDPILSQRAG